MDVPFDPLDLLPEATLNRTVIPDGLGLPRGLVGMTGAELLAGTSLAALAPDAALTVTATRIAGLIAALVSGEPESGLGVEPTAWRRAYLRHWQLTEQVYLGGGNTERLGPDLAPQVEAALAEFGLSRMTVRSTDRPSLMPLLGAARTPRGPADGRTAVLDFGQTGVKRGIAEYEKGHLVSIRVLPPVAVDLELGAEAVTQFVLDVIRRTLRDAERAAAVALSVAAYVRNNVVADTRGYYSALAEHDGAAVRRFAHSMLGRKDHLTLMHDGDAAGLAVAPRTRTAVILLGTFLGVGFVPEVETVVPLGSQFAWTQ